MGFSKSNIGGNNLYFQNKTLIFQYLHILTLTQIKSSCHVFLSQHAQSQIKLCTSCDASNLLTVAVFCGTHVKSHTHSNEISCGKVIAVTNFVLAKGFPIFSSSLIEEDAKNTLTKCSITYSFLEKLSRKWT